MPTIEFRANEGLSGSDEVINQSSQGLSGSGIGFFGAAGALASVRLNEYQDRTFVSNAAGSATAAEIDNVKFAHDSSGLISRGGVEEATINILNIPNHKSTLNIRFTHDSAVTTQNAAIYAYDRTTTSRGPSGVICKVCNIIHPEVSTGVTGSGSSSWVTSSGSATSISCHASPGTSGLSPDTSSTSDTQHDWYFGISASPQSIGSKTEFGLFFSVEYL